MYLLSVKLSRSKYITTNESVVIDYSYVFLLSQRNNVSLYCILYTQFAYKRILQKIRRSINGFVSCVSL